MEYFDAKKSLGKKIEKSLDKITKQSGAFENALADEEVQIDTTRRLKNWVAHRIEELSKDDGSFELISLLKNIEASYDEMINDSIQGRRLVHYGKDGKTFTPKSQTDGFKLENLQESAAENMNRAQEYFEALKDYYPEEYADLFEISIEEENRTN